MGGGLTDAVQACCVKVTDFCDERMPDPPRAGNPAVGEPTVDARAMNEESLVSCIAAPWAFLKRPPCTCREGWVGVCVRACLLDRLDPAAATHEPG